MLEVFWPGRCTATDFYVLPSVYYQNYIQSTVELPVTQNKPNTALSLSFEPDG